MHNTVYILVYTLTHTIHSNTSLYYVIGSCRFFFSVRTLNYVNSAVLYFVVASDVTVDDDECKRTITMWTYCLLSKNIGKYTESMFWDDGTEWAITIFVIDFKIAQINRICNKFPLKSTS